MPKKAIAKRGEEPKTPDSFMVKEVRIANKLSREELNKLQEEYIEPDTGIVLHHCGNKVRVNQKAEEEDMSFIVYYDQFRLGLRFPLCQEFAEVLKHYGIVLAQLVPNSVASVMTFIIYLRRMKMDWSLERFHKHFYCRFLRGGYAQFSTTSILTIQGLENKVEKWKSYFCRVTSPIDAEIPRVPSATSIEPLPKQKQKGLPVIVLDVRQYAKNQKIVKRMVYSDIYPDKYAALTKEEWEESDAALANLPKPKSPKKKADKKRKRAKSPIVWEENEAVAEADIPSTSRANEESGEQMLAIEDTPARIPTLRKRKKLVQGNIRDFGASTSTTIPTAAPDASEVPEEQRGIRVINRKVTMDMKRGKAIIDLTNEWFPSTSCPEGIAQSLSLALYSENMKKKITETPIASLVDQYARHQAAAWSMGSYFGVELEKERKNNDNLRTRVEELEEALQVLTDGFKEKHKKMEEAEEMHKRQIGEMTAAFKEAIEKREKDHLERIEKMKANSAQDIKNGIALCLEQLAKANAVPSEWNDTDKILKLVVASVEVPGTDEDSDRTESDEESTTVG